ncbi:MAG: DNA sulfur modification protein DndD [Cytophagales bacterium]|nr:DNA sulfur modification protein DndD [Cytophagales bacterium]
MNITKIVLENFRVYAGRQELNFQLEPKKSLFIISGENGYGKTTLLSALVWCLYGKQMAEVDDKYKNEIRSAGGYDSFLVQNLYNELSEENGSYSVSVTFSDVLLPHLPYGEVCITRSVSVGQRKEQVRILIEGKNNELTDGFTPDMFINDFILSREVAKFFFFDAEQIVFFAEAQGDIEKMRLRRAFAEVLGLKKYEDISDHLYGLRRRLREEGANKQETKELNSLQEQILESENELKHAKERLADCKEKIAHAQQRTEDLHERLHREGQSMSLEEISRLKQAKEESQKQRDKVHERFKELLNIIPFVVARKRTETLYKQVRLEEKSEPSANQVGVKIGGVVKKIRAVLQQDYDRYGKKIEEIIRESYHSHKSKVVPLLDFSRQEREDFYRLYDRLRGDATPALRDIMREYEERSRELASIRRRVQSQESKERNPIIRELRSSIEREEKSIEKTNKTLLESQEEVTILEYKIGSLRRATEKIEGKIKLDQRRQRKDAEIKKILDKLKVLTTKLMKEKAVEFETEMMKSLKELMHKDTLIDEVKVIVTRHTMEVRFYHGGIELRKSAFSKGEQQLYATALLKTLVSLSGDKFPIFIDSPLQKLDTVHSKKLLSNFYPRISDQVILLPLWEKELSTKEYETLTPMIAQTIHIEHLNGRSHFKPQYDVEVATY